MKIITGKKLWVSSSFTEKFGSEEVKPSKTVPQFKTLEKYSTNQEILASGVTEVTLEDVAAFLEKPPKGTDDGYFNIFYVNGLVVSVRWRADLGKWHVYAWRLDESGWDAGYRVFFGKPVETLDQPSDLGSLTLRVENLERVVAHHSLGDITN